MKATTTTAVWEIETVDYPVDIATVPMAEAMEMDTQMSSSDGGSGTGSSSATFSAYVAKIQKVSPATRYRVSVKGPPSRLTEDLDEEGDHRRVSRIG